MEGTRIVASSLGQLFEGQYELLETLGQGAFGTVFKAVQRSTGQTVAIKVQGRAADGSAEHAAKRAARFQREAQLCASLSHPNIVRLVDKGQNADYLYLVFEFVRGETLAQLLAREGSLPPIEAVSLTSQILEALESAHSQGIVHRDLKPENIMVVGGSTRRQVKVLDFGIGAFVAGGWDRALTALTGSHEILGTPCYAAPEQLRGEPATPRSDLYAWGLVLVECLTGQRVMYGATAAQVFQKQLSPLAVALPAPIAAHPLGAILRRALAKCARDRSQSAARIWADLQRVRVSDLVGSLAAAAPRVTKTLAVSSPQYSGEQRQATIFSCSLMALQLDGDAPDIETLDAVQRDQLALCADVTTSFGGRITGMLGNRMIAVFGLPRASDSDARRAGRAALELASRIESRRRLLVQQHRFELELRIGIHTGMVIVDTDGSPSGLALNVATRLESMAPAGTTLVSRTTRNLLMRQLRFRPFGSRAQPHALAVGSRAEPHASAVGSRAEPHASAVGSRAEPRVSTKATGTPKLEDVYELVAVLAQDSHDDEAPLAGTRLVGRYAEMRLLLDHWQQARDGAGRTVLLRGEPGIGKSRLVFEVRREAQQAGAVTFDGHCLPEDSNTALAPLQSVISRHFDIDSMDPCGGLSRLEEVLCALAVPNADALPVLCDWLGLCDALKVPPSKLSPESQRELLLTVLTQILGAAGRQHGSLLVLEDLHWADPTTLELLSRMSGQISGQRALVLTTARPELEQPIGNVMELRGLERSAIEELVSELLGDGRLDATTLARVVERTDGVPLFVEELMRDLLANGHELADQSAVIDGPIPVSLRDLLNSRLDGLGPAKETAQLAAAIGREFDLDLLAAVSLRGAEALQADLDLLVETQLVRRHLAATGARYSFRHALIREAASSSMLSQQRKAVHRGIAEAIERASPEARSDAPRLAWHYELAGDFDKAIEQRVAAGRLCAQVSAFKEADAHLEAGIRLVPLLDAQRRVATEIELRTARGAVLIASQGFATEAVETTFTRCEALLAVGGASRLQQFVTFKGLWTFHNARANFARATQLCQQMLQLARQESNPEFFLVAHECAAQTAWLTGHFSVVVEQQQACEPWVELTSQRERIMRYGLDPWTGALSFAALAHTLLGNTRQAQAALVRAKAVAADLESPAHTAALLGQEALVRLYLGSSGPRPNDALASCRSLANEALQLALRFGLRFAEGYARVLLSMVECLDGDPQALQGMTHAIQMWKFAGIRSALSWQYAFLAQGCAARGDYVDALAHARAATAHCEQNAEAYGASEAHRVLGSILADPRNPGRDAGAAQSAFQAALDIARCQQARWLELRAAHTWAVSLPEDGWREPLHGVVSWFADRQEAADTALLHECARLTGPVPRANVSD
jgi:class 3 adenylate cyclase/tetratricopeptide (TPR) repeat protein